MIPHTDEKVSVCNARFNLNSTATRCIFFDIAQKVIEDLLQHVRIAENADACLQICMNLEPA